MAAENRVQQEVHDRVMTWAGELFGAMAQPSEGGGFRVRFGSATVDVSVLPWGDADAVIRASARVVSGAELTPELLMHLLRKNAEARFGAFAIDAEGVIEFRHSIVGSACQKEELKASVQYVMLTADLGDDEIVARWGGHRARDREA